MRLINLCAIFVCAIALFYKTVNAQVLPYSFNKSSDGKINAASLQEDLEWLANQSRQNKLAINSIVISTTSIGSDPTKVAKAGDTMTGALINTTYIQVSSITYPGGEYAGFIELNGGLTIRNEGARVDIGEDPFVPSAAGSQIVSVLNPDPLNIGAGSLQMYASTFSVMVVDNRQPIGQHALLDGYGDGSLAISTGTTRVRFQGGNMAADGKVSASSGFFGDGVSSVGSTLNLSAASILYQKERTENTYLSYYGDTSVPHTALKPGLTFTAFNESLSDLTSYVLQASTINFVSATNGSHNCSGGTCYGIPALVVNETLDVYVGTPTVRSVFSRGSLTVPASVTISTLTIGAVQPPDSTALCIKNGTLGHCTTAALPTCTCVSP